MEEVETRYPPYPTPQETQQIACEYRSQFTHDRRNAALSWFAKDRDIREKWDATSPRVRGLVIAHAAHACRTAHVTDPRPSKSGHPHQAQDAHAAQSMLRTDGPRSVRTAVAIADAYQADPERALWIAGLLYMSAA